MFILRNKTEISQKRTFMIIFQKIIETVQKEFENLLSRSLQNQIRKNKNNLPKNNPLQKLKYLLKNRFRRTFNPGTEQRTF